ncbi:MAG: nucleotide exchange factor GrpE [Candidatus Sumerlaeia bacterium]|nr:nucleotide exchange factor GrpE [Candidatus Sumerlaeia bacterium]
MPPTRRKYLMRRERLIHDSRSRRRPAPAQQPAVTAEQLKSFQDSYALTSRQLEKAAAEIKRLRALDAGRAHEAQQLRADVSAVKEKAQEELARIHADMEGARKRLARERDEMKRTANADVLSKLLQPLDHFEFALKSLVSASDVDSVREGVEMIHRELLQSLGACGLEVLKPLGDTFDPNFHEAVGTVCDPSRAPQEVVEVIRPGYIVAGRVLRAAMVRVNTAEAPGAAARPSTPVPGKRLDSTT